MSFSSNVKEELIKHFSRSDKCRKAELAAIIMLDPKSVSRETGTENGSSTDGIYIYSEIKKGSSFAVKVYNIGKNISGLGEPEKIIKKPDEKRAFLRGAFICAGTMTDPEKEYYFEILAHDEKKADFIKSLMESFDISAKVTERRGKYPVYIKDSEDISVMLNVLEAHVSMMNFENVRITKEIRGSVNRKFNCDTANINKTISASVKQTKNINLVLEKYTEEELDEGLLQICRLRLDNPDASIMELGEMMNPPLGKSGVNHRLRKIAEMADKLRKGGKKNVS